MIDLRQKTMKHFGAIALGNVDGIAILILRNAPLKYYDPARDPENKEDKDKADVVFAWTCHPDAEWQLVKHFPVKSEDYDQLQDDEIAQEVHNIVQEVHNWNESGGN